MEIRTLSVDISKKTFHVIAFDSKGQRLFKKAYSRKKFHGLLSNTPPCRVVMEACGTSHHWGRVCLNIGHEAKLIAPKNVKPYVGSYKNDFNDALGIYEASTRPYMKFVAIKSQKQQELAMLHRSRERLIADRTQLVNQLRGILRELGIDSPLGKANLVKTARLLLDPEISEIHDQATLIIRIALEELAEKEQHIKSLEAPLKQICKTNELAKRLMQVPGIGFIIATALICEIADVHAFKSGRQLAAWIGLVPKQKTTGGKIMLGGISKAGNRYLRKLLIHGARSLLGVLKRDEDPIRTIKWMGEVKARRNTNISVVAMANKIARTVWVLMKNDDQRYDPHHISKPPVFA